MQFNQFRFGRARNKSEANYFITHAQYRLVIVPVFVVIWKHAGTYRLYIERECGGETVVAANTMYCVAVGYFFYIYMRVISRKGNF